MEEKFDDIINELLQIQKDSKNALVRIKKMKTSFSKGDLTKLIEGFENDELEYLISKYNLTDKFEEIRGIFASYKSKLRTDFGPKFIEECKKNDIDRISGDSMNQYRIKGIINVKIIFSKNICEISTFSNKIRIKSVDPIFIANEVIKEYKRLFKRDFNPDQFLDNLYEAYIKLRNKTNSQVLLKDIHQEIWMQIQKKDFFIKSEPSKMIAYPLDQFSVDLSKLIRLKGERVINSKKCNLSLGKDGVNIYSNDDSFNSYKFIEFI